MKNILFSVFTEYHFLLSLNIIYDHFLNKDFFVTILIIDHNGTRVKSINFDKSDSNIQLLRLDINDREQMKSFIKNLLKNTYSRLFIFHEYHIVNAYLKSNINKDCIVALGEDGTAIYQTINRKAYPSRIRSTFNDLISAYQMRLLHWDIKLISNVHGKSKRINEIWLTHPEMYQHYVRRELKINTIQLLDTVLKRHFTKSYFKQNDHVSLLSGSIIYIGRVSYNESYLNEELNFLKQIIRTAKECKIYLKPHPLSLADQITAYKNISELNIISTNLPAELLISELHEGRLIAMDSTALFYNNQSSEYQVLYRYFQQLGVYPTWRSIPFPAHVKEFRN